MVILILFFSLLLYIFCLPSGWGAFNIFNTWDGLEYLLCSNLLGIDHPPGHPFYILMGKLFSLLPIGSAAFRMNLMSAVFGAGTVVLIFMITEFILSVSFKLKNKALLKAAAAFTALVFALSRVWWTHCVIIEIYGLYLFLLSLGIYFVCLWIDKGGLWRLYLAASIFGLALAASLFSAATFVLSFVVFLFILNYFQQDPRLQAREWLKIFGLIIMGLFFYLYYPLMAGHTLFIQSMNYVTPNKVGSLPWLFWYISGKAWTGEGMFSVNRIFWNMPNYFSHLGSNFTYASFILALISLIHFSRKIFLQISQKPGKKRVLSSDIKIFLFLVITYSIVTLPQLMLQDVSNPGSTTYIYVANFYLPSFLIFIVFCGIGLGSMVDYLISKDLLLRLIKMFNKAGVITDKAKRMWFLLFIYSLLIIPVTLFSLNFNICNLRGKNEAYVIAKDMLGEVPSGSIIVSKLIYQLISTYFSRIEPISPEKNIDFINPDIISKDIIRAGEETLPMVLREKKLKEIIGKYVKEKRPIYISGDSVDQDKAPEFPFISDVYLETPDPRKFLHSSLGAKLPITELILYKVKGFHKARIIAAAPNYEAKGIANDGDFSGILELLGYDAIKEPQKIGRERISLKFYWKVLEEPKEDLLGVFVVCDSGFHRLNAEGMTGYYTVGGDYGASKWKKGALMEEEATFYIPNLPFGKYYLALGLLKGNGKSISYFPASYGRKFDFVLLMPFGIGAPTQTTGHPLEARL